MAVSAALVLAAAVFCLGQTKDNILSVFQFQTEAQAEDGGENGAITDEEEAPPEDVGGAVITCSSGSWGRCLKKIWWVDTGILFRDCDWTGYQEDNCPWWWKRATVL